MNDSLLDDIARAMTDLEPRADFSARVLSEIGRTPPRRWRAVLVPAAAAIAALILVAVRPLLVPLDLPAVSRPSIVPRIGAEPVPRTTPRRLAARRQEPPDASISADELAWLSRRLPPLETPALVVAPIQPATSFIAPITVEPIALEPISVPPPGVGSGDRR